MESPASQTHNASSRSDETSSFGIVPIRDPGSGLPLSWSRGTIWRLEVKAFALRVRSFRLYVDSVTLRGNAGVAPVEPVARALGSGYL